MNRLFPSFPGPGFSSKRGAQCSAFDMEMIFHSHVNKTKGCALCLILKLRVFGTWKCLFHLRNDLVYLMTDDTIIKKVK